MFDIVAESHEQARSAALPWDKLEGGGCSSPARRGLSALPAARLLLERNRFGAGPQIGVLCLVRDEEKAREVFSGYGDEDGLEMIAGSVEDFPWPAGSVDYIVHTACPTASRFFAEHPLRRPTLWCSARGGFWNLLGPRGRRAWCTPRAWKPTATAMPSRGFQNLLDESQVGYVDPLRVRSCYPEGKRMAEQYCCSYCSP